jgi:hypothetical protein
MAGAQVLDCWNLALSYLDLSQNIKSITENSPQAGYCNQFWDRARKIILEQCYWSFATKAVQMTLLLDQGLLPVSQLVMPGWRFVYQRPVDCLKAQAVTTQYGLRANPYMMYWWQTTSNIPVQWSTYRPPWAEMLDMIGTPPGQTWDILTDQQGAWLVYTTDPPNFALWPETAVDCAAWQLATLISGPASANQKAKQNAIKMAQLSLSRALATNLNEQQTDPYPESPSITVRM